MFRIERWRGWNGGGGEEGERRGKEMACWTMLIQGIWETGGLARIVNVWPRSMQRSGEARKLGVSKVDLFGSELWISLPWQNTELIRGPT